MNEKLCVYNKIEINVNSSLRGEKRRKEGRRRRIFSSICLIQRRKGERKNERKEEEEEEGRRKVRSLNLSPLYFQLICCAVHDTHLRIRDG